MAKDITPGALPFLSSLALSPRADDRSLWLRIAIDYFLSDARADPARREEFLTKLFDCLAGVDDAGRLAVARKLFSQEERAPSQLVAGFLALGGKAELHVLTHARDVSREALLTAAGDSWRAAASVARRGDLDAELVATLLSGGELEALIALVEKARVALSADHILTLAVRARNEIETSGDRRVAELLLARAPMRSEHAPLFLEATQAQRTAILLAAQRAELGQARAPAAAKAPREAIELLERAALAGETEIFAKVLAETLGCSLKIAQRIAGDGTGEPLAVALAAMGAAKDVSVRILTSGDLRDGADYPRVRALARLQDVLNPAAARRIVAALIADRQTREQSEPVRAAPPAERAISMPPGERRARVSPVAPREENLSPALRRRRRALAFLAAHQDAKG